MSLGSWILDFGGRIRAFPVSRQGGVVLHGGDSMRSAPEVCQISGGQGSSGCLSLQGWNGGLWGAVAGVGGHGNPSQYSCLENPLGQRSLVDYSPWDRKESDMTEQLSTAGVEAWVQQAGPADEAPGILK